MARFQERPLEARFWEKVDVRGPSECWPWLGAKNSRGYGTIRINGRTGRATHAACMLAYDRPVPSGFEVCHRCDNPSCVNPTHLWIGTKSDNMQDSIAKGRRYSPFCKHGHLLNTEKDKFGQRRCLACDRERWHRRKFNQRSET